MENIAELEWGKLEALTTAQLNFTADQFQNEKQSIAEINNWLENDTYEWKCSTVYGMLEQRLNLDKLKGKKDETSWTIDAVSEAWVQGKLASLEEAQKFADQTAENYI